MVHIEQTVVKRWNIFTAQGTKQIGKKSQQKHAKTRNNKQNKKTLTKAGKKLSTNLLL